MQIKDVHEIRLAIEKHDELLGRILTAIEDHGNLHDECCNKIVAALTKIADAIDPPVTGINVEHQESA